MATRRERERRQYQYASAQERLDKHDSGFVPNSFLVPEGMKIFKFKKAGTYELDIIPFLAGEGNPYAKKGNLWYERTFYVHTGVGPDEKHMLCLKRTFKEACPGCENASQHQAAQDLDDQSLKALRAKERQLFVIVDRNDPESGVQLFENSYYFGLGEIVDNKISAVSRFQNFWHPYDGMSLSVTVVNKPFKGNTTFKITNVEMVPRDEDLDEALLDAAPCLDELVAAKKPTYKKFKDELEAVRVEEYTEDEGEEEEVEEKNGQPEKAVERPKEHKVQPEEMGIEEGCFVTYEGQECEVLRIAADGTLTLENEDEHVYKRINAAKVQLVPTASTTQQPSQAVEQTVAEDDDLDSDLEDEAPQARRAGRK